MERPELDGDVLLVDDETAIRKGMQRVLAACGARVELAEDGTEALAKLRQGRFDVMVVDLVMPSLGGMEVLDRIAAEGLTVVSVVITAHVSLDTAVEAIRRGAFDYLPKPFEPGELVLRVQRALTWGRLRAEADRRLLELNTSRTQLRTIVEGLADGVIIVNVDGQVVLMNPAACRALGCGQGVYEPLPAEEGIPNAQLRQLIASAAEGDQAGTRRTARIEIGDSTYMAQVAPIQTQPGPGAARGEFLGTATVLRDITELMRAERAKLKFMSKVAHELRSPLAAVQGFLKVILSGHQLSSEQLHDMILRCSERVDGMVQLVRDLLDLSRSEALPHKRVEALDIAEIVADVVEANEHLAETNAVTVVTELDPHCPPIQADREDLACLLSNLLTNAIKYNLPGGRATIRVRPQDEGLLITVADTGLGIPNEALGQLGREFFRVDSPERRSIVGTGLGLSIVKRTVEAYGGSLDIESAVGKGSTFSVWLPLEYVGGDDLAL